MEPTPLTRLQEIYSAKDLFASWRQLGEALGRYASLDTARGHVADVALKLQEATQCFTDLQKFNGDAPTKTKVLVETYLAHTNKLHVPSYMGHQVPPPPPIVAVAQAMGAYCNQGLAVAEMSPFATAIERVLVKKMIEKLGWSSADSDGVVTSGGSLANLTAILAAKQKCAPQSWQQGMASVGKRLVAFTSQDAHYSIARSLGISGIGTDQLIKVAGTLGKGMDPNALDVALHHAKERGELPFCVIASAPSTPFGAIDPLRSIAAVCIRHQVWMHVDAVHGASFLFSETWRHLVDGIELADSVAWDAHKMMHVPSLCTFLLYKDKRHSFLPFQQNASYLFEERRDEDLLTTIALRTVECTKPALTLPLWFVWNIYGEQFFSDVIDSCMALTRRCYARLKQQPDFSCPVAPVTNILCLVYETPLAGLSLQERNASVKNLRAKIISETPFYITATDIEDKTYLRLTLINPLTTEHDFMALLDCIRRIS